VTFAGLRNSAIIGMFAMLRHDRDVAFVEQMRRFRRAYEDNKTDLIIRIESGDAEEIGEYLKPMETLGNQPDHYSICESDEQGAELGKKLMRVAIKAKKVRRGPITIRDRRILLGKDQGETKGIASWWMDGYP
jgi:hypothetical protein